MPRQERVTIKIPRPIYDKVNKVIAGSSFNSATDFIIYVLRDIIATEKKGPENKGLTHKELELIRKRLKNLGYL